jgi:anti-sigma factor RsiW
MPSHADLPKEETFDRLFAEDAMIDERFELISAYLDDEVSPTERKQVQQWLDEDPAARALYHELRQLNQGLLSMPMPEPSRSVEDLMLGIAIAEQRRGRFRWAMWGGGAIAAVAIGALSWFAPSGLNPRLAEVTEPESDKLMIAVSQPAVNIPAVDENGELGLSVPLDRPVVEIPTLSQ